VTLRTRFGIAAAGFAIVVAVGFGVLAFVTFARQIDRQLETLLLADLERVVGLLERPSLGASFGDPSSDGVILQFVTDDERLALWWGDQTLLPITDGVGRFEHGERTFIAAQAPWAAANGTVRLAHDVTGAMLARRDLARALVTSGGLIVLLATVVATLGVRRMLRPLVLLARQTRTIEPTKPVEVTYVGPSDEVGDMAAGLNLALAAIRRRRDEEQAFLLEVAHELAAPLTLVDYHLDELRRQRPDDPSLDAAADAARELLRTSQDLLVIARGELERELTPRVVDLRDLVRRVANEYPGVTVEADEAAPVVGDRERLVQVIRNLVRNAVQACGAAAGVRVVLRADDDAHVLHVVDNGPGMDPEAAARAFEHGYTSGGGAGVGLAVARSLVERHGGAIRIGSTSSAGTTLEVRLPSLAAHREDGDSPARGTAVRVA
jgi:two-component system, OmpR family, sensor kinase